MKKKIFPAAEWMDLGRGELILISDRRGESICEDFFRAARSTTQQHGKKTAKISAPSLDLRIR